MFMNAARTSMLAQPSRCKIFNAMRQATARRAARLIAPSFSPRLLRLDIAAIWSLQGRINGRESKHMFTIIKSAVAVSLVALTAGLGAPQTASAHGDAAPVAHGNAAPVAHGDAAPADAVSSMLLQRPANAKFMVVPGLDPCATIAPLRGDMSKGPATLMVRMKTGCAVPYHWHTPSEEIVVLQGAPLAQMLGKRPVMLRVGAYSQLPSRHVHRFRCTSKVDCLLFLVADAQFDIHYTDERGVEIPADVALRAAKKRW